MKIRENTQIITYVNYKGIIIYNIGFLSSCFDFLFICLEAIRFTHSNTTKLSAWVCTTFHSHGSNTHDKYLAPSTPILLCNQSIDVITPVNLITLSDYNFISLISYPSLLW